MKELVWFLTTISDYKSKKDWDLRIIGKPVDRVEFAPLDIRLIESKLGSSLGLTLYHGYPISEGSWLRFTPYLSSSDEALSYLEDTDFYLIVLDHLEDSWNNKCPIHEFYSYETIESPSIFNYKKHRAYPGRPCSQLTDDEYLDYIKGIPNYPDPELVIRKRYR